MEKLDKGRKRYKQTDVIYFISPCKESIEKVCADFKDETDYKYGSVHLCFSSHVSDELMLPIA
jgi:hypothetical protein